MPNSFSQLRSWFKTPEPPETKALVLRNQHMHAATGLAVNLSLGLTHVQQLADSRLQEYLGKGSFQMPDPQLYDDGSPLFVALSHWGLSPSEYLTLMIALAPALQPNFYDLLIHKHLSKAGEFPEFGGVKNANTRTTLPTGDTVLFLLNGTDLTGRLTTWQQILSHDSRLIKQQIILLEDPKDGEPATSGRITVSKEYVEMFLLGREWQPRFSSEFPAQPITTLLDWDNLIVSKNNLEELRIIQDWLEHEQTIKTDPALSRMIKPGYRALFYGPPGTGKTLTAALVGKRHKRPVYRVDLSQMVSKYIGETSKIASNLFDIAENRNWILFFDEADSLFGKRTSVTSSNDRYANQDVSYLLQRVEDYNGLIILASNYKHNIDNAFMRRFQSVIHFSMPDAQERLTLWQQTKPEVVKIADDISFEELAQKFELSGASILNVMYISTIRGLADEQKITRAMLIEEIRKELAKENKTI
ncbi:hypothetical protein GCM10010967_56680 [Dyadobacter beijingensis]|uniref:AAA+ ATPase domain-containing protein n=1 Tax=Dyadobacter beijingensis TaxID=365489 RepID=A0ABQ2INY5_9BACT|nr:ATP-binding protein [Dyadobacter beijingensis]GGN13232.1 hypothetical protein GCM10010967_56680 [Dyadobacter beijingensis]